MQDWQVDVATQLPDALNPTYQVLKMQKTLQRKKRRYSRTEQRAERSKAMPGTVLHVQSGIQLGGMAVLENRRGLIQKRKGYRTSYQKKIGRSKSKSDDIGRNKHTGRVRFGQQGFHEEHPSIKSAAQHVRYP